MNENIEEKDLLDRTQAVEFLSNLLVSKTDKPFVLAINAEWGTGKTFFVKLLQKYLKETKKITSIYFNAWENDFSKDPFISIFSELQEYFDKLDRGEILKSTIGLATNVVTNNWQKIFSGIISKLSGIDKDICEDLAKIINLDYSTISSNEENIFNSYSKEKQLIINFKKSLEKLVGDKPLIFFIDELDRCRPIYSIELLERIKHIFGIKNLIFVLSMDKKQLAESIKAEYGNLDAERYLRRFINMEYTLKNENVNINEFCEKMNEELGLVGILTDKDIKFQTLVHQQYLDYIKLLSIAYKLTPRDIQQTFKVIETVFRLFNKDEIGAHSIYRVIILIFVRLYDNEFYLQLSHRKTDTNTIQERMIELTNIHIPNDYKNSKRNSLIAYIINILIAMNSTVKEWEEFQNKNRNRFEVINKEGNKEEITDLEKAILEFSFFYSSNYTIRDLSKLVRDTMRYVDFSYGSFKL